MKRALIVEDDPVWANIFERYARQVKFEPKLVNSPQLAMDALDENTYDVIVLDMLLLSETGMALLNEIRSYSDIANIPIIVCTNVDGLTLEQLRPFGVRDLFDKSKLEPMEFRLALERAGNE